MPRPGVLQLLAGCCCLGGGVAMALVFKGMWAVAFAILEGMLLAAGVGLLGRALLGLPAALLAWPLRRLGASGLLASTSLAANRWRTAALATPIVLVAMLAGTQGIVQTSGRRDAETVTAARVTAPFVVTGRDGAPLPEGTAERITDLPGVDGVSAARATELYPDGAALGEDAPWPAAGLTAPAPRRSTCASAPAACATSTATASRSATCSPRRATSRSATRSEPGSPTRPTARCASRRSTTAPPASATSSWTHAPAPSRRSSSTAPAERSTASPPAATASRS